jgi:hypothetical protein
MRLFEATMARLRGNRQHAERDHEGRHAHISDQNAVKRADRKRREKRGADPGPDRMARVHHHPQHDSGEADDGSDRQVDAAGNDDRRHAERNDADERKVAGNVEQISLSGERIGRKRQRCHRDHRRDKHPEGLAR